MNKMLLRVLLLASFGANAQQRYLDPVFDSVEVTPNVVYGQAPAWTSFPVDLRLDVYEPQGDTAVLRPLMVFAHGGSFVAGSKTDAYVVEICEHFARKGYVCASISYRLGIDFLNFAELDKELRKASIRAIQDYRASIRYWHASAQGGNPFQIDTNRIVAAGYSAGSIAALHAQLFQDPSTAPMEIQMDITALGGLDGGSAQYLGQSSRAAAVWDMAGALLDTMMLNRNDVSAIGFHGDADDVVPYAGGFATYNGSPVVAMHGSAWVMPRLERMGGSAEFHGFPGAGHDLLSDGVMADTILNRTTRFLYREVISNPALSLVDNGHAPSPRLYPNPAGSTAWIELEAEATVHWIDLQGRCLWKGTLSEGGHQLDVSKAAPGLYLLVFLSETGSHSLRLIVE
ncbi:carboxylesterase family protein [bacterium]|nr:carboxylesterase family protein [bacterium]